jgi:hypothetical protein
MKRGNGIKGRDDRSSGTEILVPNFVLSYSLESIIRLFT